MSKPFGAGELLARIRVALRHAAGASHDQGEAAFRVGDLHVGLLHRRVAGAGTEVRLTPIEYKLLTTLVRYAGKVMTHPQLLREVWGRRTRSRVTTCASTWPTSATSWKRSPRARAIS